MPHVAKAAKTKSMCEQTKNRCGQGFVGTATLYHMCGAYTVPPHTVTATNWAP